MLTRWRCYSGPRDQVAVMNERMSANCRPRLLPAAMAQATPAALQSTEGSIYQEPRQQPDRGALAE